MNAAIVTGSAGYLELARVPLDTVIDHAITASVAATAAPAARRAAP